MSASASLSRPVERQLWPHAFSAAVVLLTLAHPSATRMQTWPWAGLASTVWLFPIIALIVSIVRTQRLRLPPPAVSAGLVGLALTAGLSARFSPFGALSLAQAWPVFGTVALCFLVQNWFGNQAGDHAATRLAQIVAVAGALIGATSLVAWLITATPSPFLDRNTFPFGHSTYTAGFVVLTMPWLVERAWTASGFRRLLWTSSVFASLGALVGTSSRGGVLALVLVALATGAIVLLRSRWSLRQKLLLTGSLIVVAMAVVLTNPRLRELVTRGGWGDTARASNRERSAMLDAGIRLYCARPWLGWGPGSVPLAYPQVRAQLAGGDENVLQLHDTPVQTVATLGTLGLVAGGFVLVGTAVAFVRTCRERTPSASEAAAAASLGGYAIFSLTDHQLDLPLIAGIAAVALAAVNTSHARSAQVAWPARAAILCGIAALAGAPTLALRDDLLGRHDFDLALAAMEDGKPAAALASVEQAASRVPRDAFYEHQAAAWILGRRNQAATRERHVELTNAAVMRLRSSLGTGVHLEFAHFNLGWLLLELNQPVEAAQHFAAAAKLVPDKGGVYFGLGLALHALQRNDDAIRAFALEWLDDPRQFTSPAWEVPELASLKPAVRVEALRLLARVSQEHLAAAGPSQWVRWWLGGADAPPSPAANFSIESAACSAFLGAASSLAQLPPYPWARLHAAWRGCADLTFADIAAGDRGFAAALASRAQQYPTDFRAFVSAPAGDHPALVITSQRQRRGYGVLALHPDAPALVDAYVVQENRVAARFAAGLFPPKGWLPGRILLALLPPIPR